MRKLMQLAGACLVAACGDPTSSAVDRVVITATSSASEVATGRNVTITIKVFNPREADVRVAFGDCQRPFDVLNLFGAVVGPRPAEVCTLALTAPTTIPGGGSFTVETTWAGDGSRVGPADESIYLTPGRYLVRPRLQLVDENETAFGKPLALRVTAGCPNCRDY